MPDKGDDKAKKGDEKQRPPAPQRDHQRSFNHRSQLAKKTTLSKQKDHALTTESTSCSPKSSSQGKQPTNTIAELDYNSLHGKSQVLLPELPQKARKANQLGKPDTNHEHRMTLPIRPPPPHKSASYMCDDPSSHSTPHRSDKIKVDVNEFFRSGQIIKSSERSSEAPGNSSRTSTSPPGHARVDVDEYFRSGRVRVLDNALEKNHHRVPKDDGHQANETCSTSYESSSADE